MDNFDKDKQIKLDKKAWKILSELINNPRKNLNEISKNIGLKRNSVEYRIKQFQEKELILNYKTIINSKKLGFNEYRIFLTINTSNKEKEFIEKLKNSPYISSIMSYKGKFNYEISIILNNELKLLEIYSSLINNISISSEEILLVLEVIKSEVLPLKFFKKEINPNKIFLSKKEEKYLIDENDLKIMEILSQDATISNIEISNISGISSDMVRYKIKKLVSSNFIVEFRPNINYKKIGLSMETILLKLNYYYYDRHKDFEKFLLEHQNIVFALKCFGPYDYIVYILNENSEELISFFDEIKDNFGPIFKNYDLLLLAKEYKYLDNAKIIFKQF